MVSGRLCECAQLLDCALILSTSPVFQPCHMCGHQGLKLTTAQLEWAFHFVHCCFNVCFVLGSHEPQTGLELAVWLRLTLLTLLCFILFWRQLLYVALAVLKLIQ